MAVPTAVPSTYTVTVLFASAVPCTVGWLLLVLPSELLLPVSVAALSASPDGADGAVVSMVMLRPDDTPLLTPPLLAIAVMTWPPSTRLETKL
ncbi:hypothetical protein A203_19740 [Chromobacterium violaceum]